MKPHPVPTPVRVVLLLVTVLFPGSLLAEVKLASPFTSHMVLQRGVKEPVGAWRPAVKK
jgi:hypothetical protein